MIKSILLAMDGSDHSWSAWQYAFDFARVYSAWLRVVSVVDTRVLVAAVPSIGGEIVAFDAVDPELETKMKAEQSQLLATVERRTDNAGVTVNAELERGVPSEVICAHESTVDLIVLGHRGNRSMLDRYFSMGSVADDVVRKSMRPVLISPERHAPIKRILVADDGSAPAKRALHWAANMAATMVRPITVVHVNRNKEQGETILREAQEYLRPYHLDIAAVFREGAVAEQILQTAEEIGAGLIAMGAHGHGRIREALLGSVTEAMLQKMDRPLLMTR